MAAARRITTRNARFQQWQAQLTNRTKRQRAGEFLVQGVRPISVAVERGWPVRTLLYDAERGLSGWAAELLAEVPAERVAMAPELLAELGEKDAGPPELVAVAELPPDDLDRVPVGPDFLGVVFDRPTSPGNIGSVIRSADAFGASGMVVTGHAADAYDPKSVRASTGSLFALPVVRAPGHREVLSWLAAAAPPTGQVTVVGTDETGTVPVDACDLTGPVLLLVGNETRGLSAAWRERCDVLVSIPMGGSASSLNAANAASVVLYEAARQRRARTG
ncbi:TrmH family RNA methyltransferase [Streptomyces sp. DSM 44915]|uniref:TrmH family RNA methyltransferase n=1 Tax=Streptomyces chisholmiae TaxID=3075540 RepID=A0ABU2JN77_9ACTN|nr:TrmH family RNA methyltransferase [Streptomyces sp. DSM 44915]MDT0266445.1 TrmH family RNA methyltransferase [Streptomyces sp. DSM 44915]